MILIISLLILYKSILEFILTSKSNELELTEIIIRLFIELNRFLIFNAL